MPSEPTWGENTTNIWARILLFMRRHIFWVVLFVVAAVIGGIILGFYVTRQSAIEPQDTTTPDSKNQGAQSPNGALNPSASGDPLSQEQNNATGGGTNQTSNTAGTGSTSGSGGTADNAGGGGTNNGSGNDTQQSCALPAYPDASCTGWEHTGVTLTTITTASDVDGAYFDPDGNLNITQDGKVIDGIRFDGCIFIRADNVTIKRSLLTRGWCAEGTISAQLGSYTNITIEDVEIDGENEDPGFSGISGNNFTCLRCNIHGVGTPIRAATNVRVTDSYLHGNSFAGSSHNSGLSVHEGGDIVLQHNYIRCDAGFNCTAALELNSKDSYDETGAVLNDITIENNRLYSASGYCMYGGWDTSQTRNPGGPAHATNIKVLNNAFDACNDLGPLANWAPTLGEATAAGNLWSGNFVYASGSTINAY